MIPSTYHFSQAAASEAPVVEPMAVQLCARKVAAVAGDIRKALDVCRRAVEIVENDVRRQTVLTAISGMFDRNTYTHENYLPIGQMEYFTIY